MSVANLGRRCGFVTVLAALFVLALSLCSAPLAHAQLSLVYVEGSSTAGNSIVAFSNDGAGHLTPLAGSPYATNGTGPTGIFSDIQFDSDGELVANTAGKWMFGVNGHSNTVTAFAINDDGTLSTGTPFASGGQDPVSIALHENAYSNGDGLMVVVNKNSDPGQSGGKPNYTTFRVTPTGGVTKNLSLNLPAGTSPAQVLARPGSRVQFFGVEFMNSLVTSYKVNAAGRLVPIGSVTNPSVVLGGVVHPSVKGLYASLPAAAQISVVKYNQDGTMSLLREVANQGNLACWLGISAAGDRLYSGETGSGTVTVYDTSHSNTPTQLQHFQLTPSNSLPAHLKVDPTGKFLYVVDRKGSLHVLDIASDGTLSEPRAATNLGFAAGTVPQGLVVLSK